MNAFAITHPKGDLPLRRRPDGASGRARLPARAGTPTSASLASSWGRRTRSRPSSRRTTSRRPTSAGWSSPTSTPTTSAGSTPFAGSEVLVSAAGVAARHAASRGRVARLSALSIGLRACEPRLLRLRRARRSARSQTSADLAGDGCLLVVPTPGHTPGHASLLVRGGELSYLLRRRPGQGGRMSSRSRLAGAGGRSAGGRASSVLTAHDRLRRGGPRRGGFEGEPRVTPPVDGQESRGDVGRVLWRRASARRQRRPVDALRVRQAWAGRHADSTSRRWRRCPAP